MRLRCYSAVNCCIKYSDWIGIFQQKHKFSDMTTAVVNYDRIVKKFIDHSLTLYDVEKIAHDLKVYFSRGDDVDKKKRIVVKHVLLQLLTEEPNNLHYQQTHV